jgi:hypothetical protein
MFWESSVENGTYVNSSIILIPGWLCRQRRIWCRGTFIYYIEGDYRKYTKYNNVHIMFLSCNVRKFPNFTEKCRNIQHSNHFQEYPLSRPLSWNIARWMLSNNQSINQYNTPPLMLLPFLNHHSTWFRSRKSFINIHD